MNKKKIIIILSILAFLIISIIVIYVICYEVFSNNRNINSYELISLFR